MENYNINRRYFLKNAALTAGFFLYNSDNILGLYKPIANERNLILHFESLFNKSTDAKLIKACKDMASDFGAYLKKNFSLYDYQLRYFDNSLMSGKNANYYHKKDREDCTKFWNALLETEIKKRKNPKRADKRVKFSAVLSSGGGGGTAGGSGAGGCLIGFSYEETQTDITACLCALNYYLCGTWRK